MAAIPTPTIATATAPARRWRPPEAHVATPYGPITGVAPKAYIGNYKVLDASGGTSDVVAKAIDDAVADGMDVLNISLGAYVTSYSDIDPNEVGQAAIARAAQAGVIVVVAAGNDGPGAGTISDYASARRCHRRGRDPQRSLAGLRHHHRWRRALCRVPGRWAGPGPGD